MQAGMIVSNEPGYYEDGGFGIRIENLLTVREAATPFKFGGLPYLSFERLTLVPLQRKLMDLQVRLQGSGRSPGALNPELLLWNGLVPSFVQYVPLRVLDVGANHGVRANWVHRYIQDIGYSVYMLLQTQDRIGYSDPVSAAACGIQVC